MQVVHESLQSVDTVDEVDNTLLLVLLVQRLPDIADGFAENGRESDTHGSLDCQRDNGNECLESAHMGEGVLVVTSVWRISSCTLLPTWNICAYMQAKEAGLSSVSWKALLQRGDGENSLGLTREGVRGYC